MSDTQEPVGPLETHGHYISSSGCCGLVFITWMATIVVLFVVFIAWIGFNHWDTGDQVHQGIAAVVRHWLYIP